MLSRINFVLVVAFAVVALVCVSPSYANLIQNGSFETTNVTGAGEHASTSYDGVTAAMPNWDLERGGTQPANWGYIDINSWLINAQDGNVFLNLLNGPSSVAQTFAVTASQTYNVSFYEALRDSSTAFGLNMTLTPSSGTLAGTSGTLTVSGTNPLAGFVNAQTGTWTQFTFSFVPSASGNVALKFVTNDPTGMNGNGVFLDNVSVTPAAGVPEPSTLALLAAGLAGLLCYAWRKRR
jgi:hypothetical protein